MPHETSRSPGGFARYGQTFSAARLLACSAADLTQAWKYFERANLHKLSAVDATSFVLMSRARIRWAFAFDHHFAAVGFRLVG